MRPNLQDERRMHRKPRTPEETYGPALRKAKRDFRSRDPHEMADAAAVLYHSDNTARGAFEIRFLDSIYRVEWPAGTVWKTGDDVESADIATSILLLHYLLSADGTPLPGQWIAFRNLPGGLGYDTAFEGRASLRLAHIFGDNRLAFESAAKALLGENLAFGDASFLFRALPRVWLAIILHVADDEFPASAQVLFDAGASHYLPTEDLAVLGGMLTGRLIGERQK
jgi:hypothetical protein